MNAIRKLFLSISIFMLIVTLLLVNVTWVVKNTVGSREVVKTIIKDSGFYDNIIDEIVKNIEKEIKNDNSPQDLSQQTEQIVNLNQNIPQENNSDNGGPDIDVVILGRAANAVFTPENIQQKLEAVLDGTYNWLDGDSPDLQFILDLGQEKIALASSLASEATTRVSSLPVCSSDQLAAANDVDVFSIECLPPEVDAKITEFQQGFANSDEFLSDVVLSASDIKVNVDGVEKPISEAIPSAPSWYQFANQVIWFMLIAALIWVLLVMFLSKTLRFGIKHVAIVFLVAGILVALSAFASSQVTRVIKVSSDSIEETIVLPLAKESTRHAAQVSYSVSVAYISIFAAAILYLYLTRSKKSVNETAPLSSESEKPTQDKPTTEISEIDKKTSANLQDDTKKQPITTESESKTPKI